MRWRFLYWLPAVAVATTIFALSSVSDFGALEHPFLAESDKTIHAIAYGILAVSILWGILGGFDRVPFFRTLVLAAAMASIYGITDEFHQYFVPGRAAVWQDWAADTVGAVIGVGAVWLYTRMRFYGKDLHADREADESTL